MAAAVWPGSGIGGYDSLVAGEAGRGAMNVAVASSMLAAAYHMRKNGVDYQDLGAWHFTRRDREKIRSPRFASLPALHPPSPAWLECAPADARTTRTNCGADGTVHLAVSPHRKTAAAA
jgi:hypothetical protein